MAADWSIKFKWQYDYAKACLDDEDRFADEWEDLIEDLQDLQGKKGFKHGKAKALADLRKKVRKIGKKDVSMAEGILAAVKVGGNNAPSVPQEAKMRASALKFLAHTYLIEVVGGRTMWVHSSPKAFKHWPSVHMHNRSSTTLAVKDILNANDEQFSDTDKKNLINAAHRALYWAQKTSIVLAAAPSKKGQTSASRSLVKKWFADASVTDKQLDDYIAKLEKGFKEIIATLNKGSMILTDYMGIRASTEATEVRFRNAEAFTWRNRGEGLDVIYIESAFFKDHPGNVLPPMTNWARILIHELTHLCAGTEDIVNGKARYAHYGIGPHAGYPGSQCIRNADNWAFFAADCGGGVTPQQAARALKII